MSFTESSTTTHGDTPALKAEDFKGEVTGGGIKMSMASRWREKPPLAWIDPIWLLGVGRVLGYGGQKYKPGNWLLGMSWNEVISGMERHIQAIKAGEDIDPETGELHVAHLSCGAMFLFRYMADERYKKFDDRMFNTHTS